MPKGNDASRKYWFAGEGEGGGDAKGEGGGVRQGDFGTSGNRASFSKSFPSPCTEGFRGTLKTFPSSTRKSRGQSLSLPLAVGFHELVVLCPDMEVPDCAYCSFAVDANELLAGTLELIKLIENAEDTSIDGSATDEDEGKLRPFSGDSEVPSTVVRFLRFPDGIDSIVCI